MQRPFTLYQAVHKENWRDFDVVCPLYIDQDYRPVKKFKIAYKDGFWQNVSETNCTDKKGNISGIHFFS